MTRVTTAARLTDHDDIDLEAQPAVQQLLDVHSLSIPPPSLGVEALMVREEEVNGSTALQAASLAGSRQSTSSPTVPRSASACQEGHANSESPITSPQEDQGQIQADEQTRIPGMCMTLVIPGCTSL
jgi:hypothetical protein